jgi:hypothetical protein
MLPHLIWQTLSRQSGIDISLLGQNASKLRNFDSPNRNQIVQQLSKHIQTSFNIKHHSSKLKKKLNRFRFYSSKKNYLFIVYMLVKFLYVLNLIGQIILMDSFFEFRNYSFGFEFLKKFFKGDDYSRIDKAFPRVTFCDFTIRNMGDNIHKHSVQCALPVIILINFFFFYHYF